MEHPDPATTPLGTHYELSTHLIAREVIARGWQPRWLRPALFVIEVDDRVHAWNMTRCEITSTIGAEITGRKDYTRQLLRSAGVAVARGGSYRPGEHSQALADAAGLWPVVVKPAGRGGGRGVTVGVTGEAAFAAAWKTASSRAARIVVEQQMPGDEARFTVVAGRTIAVCGRRRPNVVGDGASTVAELVAAKDAARGQNPHLAGKRLQLTEARVAYLATCGLTPDTVPEVGEQVWLEDRGGATGPPSTWTHGADSVDTTDAVHPSYLAVAAHAATAIPGLGVAGIDMIASDWTRPAAAGNHVVVEVNSRPAIGAHHCPWEGKPRDVAAAIVDACGVPDAGDDNDPDW